MTPEAFAHEFGPEFTEQNTNPYGSPTPHTVKPGLTRRGKAAIAVAATVVAGTGFIWYQSHSAQVAKDQKESVALEIRMKQLELEEIRMRNDQQIKDAAQANTAQAALQKNIDKCVNGSAHLIGKGYGSPSKADVIADCRQQYAQDVNGSDMAQAASAKPADGGDSQIGTGALLGLAAGGGLLVAVTARRSNKSNPA